LLKSFSCLLPSRGSVRPDSEQIEGIKFLSERYQEDIDCSSDIAAAELELWFRQLSTTSKMPASAVEAFCLCDGDRLPAIKKLLQILSTLLVTTCTSERSFSTLRRLKTYLRNSSGQDRLNGLALLNVHRNITVEVAEVTDELCTKPRRLPFQL